MPFPLRDGQGLAGLLDWLHMLMVSQALPGTVATVQLTMIALVVTGLLSALLFPLISPLLFGRISRTLGHLGLVVMRSSPEYILAFILLQLWGLRSMLSAIVAVPAQWHNHRASGRALYGNLTLRSDAVRGVSRYAFEILPRVYNSLLALLFYRWEVIMRETAILGILGVATLGFYVDSAFAELRFDRAVLLIAITALLK